MSDDTEQLSWLHRQSRKGMFWVGLVFINSTLIYYLILELRYHFDGMFSKSHVSDQTALVYVWISNTIAIVLLWVFRGKLEWSEKTLSDLPDEMATQGDVAEDKDAKDFPEIENVEKSTKNFPEID